MLVLGGAVSVLAACADSDAASETSQPGSSITSTTVVERSPDDPGDVEQVCAELQIVQDLAAEISDGTDEILAAVGSGAAGGEDEILASFSALATQIETDLPTLLAAYDRAADAAPADIATDIRAVADGTALLTPPLAEAFRNARSVDDLAELDDVFGAPDMQQAATDAGLASLRLDDFTNPNCGFQFSNS